MNKVCQIFETFLKDNPHPKPELHYTNHFTCLVAVVLSAQATDKQVNKVTEQLFQTIHSPQEVIDLGLSQLEESIKSIGLYRSKAKNIYALSEVLIKQYNGQVPPSREQLVKLPGIGQKTANVVLNILFDRPFIAVDTHVFRVTKRLGIASGISVKKTEEELERILLAKYKPHASLWLVLHGRYVCKARNPLCNICKVNQYCGYYLSQKERQ